MYEALTKGSWLYINRDQQIEKLKLRIEELENTNKELRGYKSIAEVKIDCQKLICPRCEKRTFNSELSRLQKELQVNKRGLTFTILALVILLAVFIRWSTQIEDPRVIETLQTTNMCLILVGVGVITGMYMFGRKK